jgi:hypothetical protein
MNQRGARSCEERNLMEVDPDVGKRWVKLAKNSKSPKMVALLSLVGFKIQHDHSLLQFSWVPTFWDTVPAVPPLSARSGTQTHFTGKLRRVHCCGVLTNIWLWTQDTIK